MSTVGSLEEEAKKRKQRLLALKAKKEGKTVEQVSKEADGDNFELPKPIFRSYKPTDESLKENKLDDHKPADVSDRVTEQLAAGKPEPIIEEVDLASLAPRKPDWDLKRDVSKKLEKLDRRTQRAIAELIRERLQGQQSGDGGDLARAVISAKQQQEDDDD